jgi:hypothetical protein
VGSVLSLRLGSGSAAQRKEWGVGGSCAYHTPEDTAWSLHIAAYFSSTTPVPGKASTKNNNATQRNGLSLLLLSPPMEEGGW